MGDAAGYGDGSTDSRIEIIDTLPKDLATNQQYVADLAAVARREKVRIVLGLHARQPPDRPPTFSTEHDARTLEAASLYPDVYFPALNGFDPKDPNAPTYVESQLATGKWKMVGELDLRNSPKQLAIPANHTVMMSIYRIAGQYGVPVMIHFETCYQVDGATGAAELGETLANNANTKFIYAHSCPMNLMKTYSNLYCEYEFASGPLPNELQERVMLGTDVQWSNLSVQGPGQPVRTYAEAMALFREKLAAVDSTAATAIGNGLAKAILGIP